MEASKSIYQKLQNDEFRLLTLLPAGDKESSICCTLSHTSFPPPCLYETISYVWGDHVFDSPIVLDDYMFYVTANLAFILRYLRRTEESRLLWVDAICINQQDMQERAQQVSLMRAIFSKCDRALAWVGPGANHPLRERLSEDVAKGMDFMKRIGEQDIETLRPMEENYVVMRRQESDAEGGGQFDAEDDMESDAEDNMEVVNDTRNIKTMIIGPEAHDLLYKLFRHASLWSRSWIVQELACSPQVTLLCEGGELDWQIMSNFLRDQPYADALHLTFSHGSRLAKSLQYMFQEPLQIEHQRWISQDIPLDDHTPLAPKSTLLDVLARFRSKESSDPKDKVYSLLGLVEEDHGIAADYTKSVAQLFQEVTMGIMNRTRNLDIISQNPFEPRHHEYLRPGFASATPDEGSLPSWVADLRLKGADVLFAHRNIFNAGKPNCEVPCRLIGRNRRLLVLRGCIIGRIGPILQSENSWASIREIMLMYLGKHVLEDNPVQFYPFFSQRIPDREPVVQAYWRTILKDCTKPPRMRRLGRNEIALLNKRNGDALKLKRSRGTQLYSYKSSFNDPAPSSTFPHLEDDGELATGRDSGISMVNPKNLEQSSGLEKRFEDNDFMFVMAENGVFLTVRKHSTQGDVVVVLDGAKVPMILREAQVVGSIALAEGDEGIDKVYQVVGPAYAHGFMDGEAEAAARDGQFSREDFVIA